MRPQRSRLPVRGLCWIRHSSSANREVGERIPLEAIVIRHSPLKTNSGLPLDREMDRHHQALISTAILIACHRFSPFGRRVVQLALGVDFSYGLIMLLQNKLIREIPITRTIYGS
jgi:hypothetical protein